MPTLLTLSLRPDIKLITEANKIILQSSTRKLTIEQPTVGIKAALNTLANSCESREFFKKIIIKHDGFLSLMQFDKYLQKLINLGWICHSLQSLVKAIPMAENYEWNLPNINSQEEYFSLSRFAYCYTDNSQIVLKSPLSQTKLILNNWRASALIAKLSQPENYINLATEIPDITEEIAQNFLALLLAAQMLSASEDSTLKQWEFHDLMFHTCSRNGRHDSPVGATYRFLETVEPLPSVKSIINENTIQLKKPNINILCKTDISLTQALESRSSIREHDTNPITLNQLGELLYRSARVKDIVNTDKGEISFRPYPSGGAIYELEIYPVIYQCQGLEKGIYHYQPSTHQLCQISEWTPNVEGLIKDAYQVSGQQTVPQVLLVVTARFGRLFWKYQSIAYSLILKHVGALYQTIYLVSTSMKLAPCALGVGNSDSFAKATGIDYYTESSVGEFMLGSLKQ